MTEPKRRGRPKLPPRSCKIEGCEKPLKARGLCSKHYHRLQRHGDPLAGGTERLYKVGDPCRIEGCDRLSRGQGMCSMHVTRLRKRNGDITDPPTPSYRYRVRGGYIDLRINGKRIAEHRHVMEQILGRELLDGENVHHKNRVRDDNRPENLELWLTSQPSGGRVTDLVAFVVDHYRPLVEAALKEI